MTIRNKWIDLLDKTNGLTTPAMVKGVLNQKECNVFLELLSKTTQEFTKKKKPNNGLKMFKEGVQNNTLNELLIENPPTENESLDKWSQRIFEGEPFGAILNFVENYNNDIVQKMANKIRDLLELHGTPWAGLSMLFFMGDYGFTPFGVHRGSPGEDGVLFHLGPAKKTFYIWETETYNRLTNYAPSYKNTEEILHAATPYILEPGDAISFPDDMYHIANTEEFSVSLVLDYRRASKRSIKQLLLDELQKIEITPDVPLGHDHSINPIEKIDFYKETELATNRIKKRLASNGGFLKKSNRLVFPFDAAGIYQIKNPFQIQILNKHDKQLTLFSRGHEITTANTPDIIELIQKINAGETIEVSKMDIDFTPESTGFYQFELLLKIGETDILDKK